MSTDDFVDNHFLCQLKMEEEINCAHSVTLTAPGLIIDKGGVVSDTLSYSFTAGQGLVSQDIGIVGHNPGEYTIFADITSPYFVTASGLKVKKDKIGITIRQLVETEGWNGTDHGLTWGNGVAAYWTEPDLYYRYTHPSSAPQQVRFTYGHNLSGDFMGVIMTGAGSDSKVASGPGSDATFYITTPGVYIFRPYLSAKYTTTASSATLGTVSIQAQKIFGGFGAEIRVPKRRGIRIAGGQTISVGWNTAISNVPVMIADEQYRPGSFTPELYEPKWEGSNPGVHFTLGSANILLYGYGQFTNPGNNFAAVEYYIPRPGGGYAGVLTASLTKI
jgi:hypothetical protein